MQLTLFAHFLERLEKTPSRLEITRILAELLKETDAVETDKVVFLSLGVLAPNYEGVILNLAEKMMIRVLALAFDKSEIDVKALYKKAGDLGNVAEELSKQKSNNDANRVSVAEVYQKLFEVANDNGAGSQDRKIEKMARILSGIDPLSARFIARIPVGKLRLGFSEKTVIAALAIGDEKKEEDIEKAYNIRPNIGYVAKLVKEGKLESAKPEIGVPVVPMLAQRLNSTSEMIKKMGEVSVEPKFDGLRIFIHYKKKGNITKVFTRNMNSIDLDTFPELKEVGKFIRADEVILDSEAIGVDPEREMFLDFQKTIQRRRKHEIAKNASEIPLQFQVFDIIFVNGQSLINEPYVKRRETLKKVVEDGKLLRVDENVVTKDPEVIKTLHQKYLKMGLEGVVVKKAMGKYVSGRTGWNWVKMKEVEGKRGKLSDTIDCVVMGATSGRGKRAGFGVGQFLAGIKDGDTFKTVTKVGTGLTDKQFKELSSRLDKIKTKEKPKDYEAKKDLTPDFWVTPKVIVELAADEITVSPKHTAGLALRFPRLVRFRDDKSSSEVTSIDELKELFRLQKSSN
ncbi:MAG: putative DNA ligase [Candidatus Woesebacteria bacterium GW2011_GWD1_41_12]|uniref:DNA ligase (ATP) n=1 Tax=Candidatus Woesebacteria bacterium GW2011_GWD1_41_12 TaxID=1618593 RepID=A0A0G0ULZ9_9BACT|nr:MAG: putative DNA ligase [Candidatus Woesebacteria bacterium GW2011_GWD1_41_12]